MTLLLVLEGSKHVKQGPTEMLNRVPPQIGRSSYFLSANELTQISYDPGLKVMPVATMELLRDATVDKEVVPQALYCSSLLVWGRNSYCLLSEVVDIMTKMSLKLLEPGSTQRKSMHTSLSGLVAVILRSGAAFSGKDLQSLLFVF